MLKIVHLERSQIINPNDRILAPLEDLYTPYYGLRKLLQQKFELRVFLARHTRYGSDRIVKKFPARNPPDNCYSRRFYIPALLKGYEFLKHDQ